MSEPKRVLEFGDIVQITEEAGVRDVLRGALAIVEEVKPWGVVAMVEACGSQEVFALKPSGYAFVRLQWNEFYLTGGKAKVFKWVPSKEQT